MTIAIIDGQGGGVGRGLIEALRARAEDLRIIAVGTNALATSAMLKAGADQGATGENAVRRVLMTADVIAGPIGIVLSDAMLGEITPGMACAISASFAPKVLVPISRCGVHLAGLSNAPLGALIQQAAEMILRISAGEALE